MEFVWKDGIAWILWHFTYILQNTKCTLACKISAGYSIWEVQKQGRKGRSWWIWTDWIRVPPQHVDGWRNNPALSAQPSTDANRTDLSSCQCSRYHYRLVSTQIALCDDLHFVSRQIWISSKSLIILLYAQLFYAALAVCVVSTLNTYYGHAIVAMEPWALGLLAASLFIFLLCFLLVYRQPQTKKKVSFMVRTQNVYRKSH